MTSFWPIVGSSVLTKAILHTKNKFIAEILLKNGAKILTPQESYHMISTICWQRQNQSWFLQHKDQLLQAGLDVNAKDHRGLTVLENILASDSSEMEMALQMGVNPELPDSQGKTIQEFYNYEVGLQTYDVVVQQMNKNMQILRCHHLLLKQMQYKSGNTNTGLKLTQTAAIPYIRSTLPTNSTLLVAPAMRQRWQNSCILSSSPMTTPYAEHMLPTFKNNFGICFLKSRTETQY